MDNFIWAQIIGVIATLTFIISVQCKKKHHILMFVMANAALAALSFVLLGAWSGMMTNLLSLVPTIFAYHLDRKAKKSHTLMAVPFLALVLAGWSFTYSNAFDFLALFGTSVYVISLFQSEGNSIRQLLIANQIAWTTYNVISKLYSGAFFGVCFLISDIIALYRFRKGKKPLAAHEKRHAKHRRTIFG
jgi:hypothetical protein